jgi:biotin synthase-like enzyme
MYELFKRMQEDVVLSHHLSDKYYSEIEDIILEEIEKRKVDVYLSVGEDDDERTKHIGTYSIYDLNETDFDSEFYPPNFKLKFEEHHDWNK